MGKITVNLNDDLERELREILAKKYGVKKGALGAAVNEAIRMWIAKAKADLKQIEELEKG